MSMTKKYNEHLNATCQESSSKIIIQLKKWDTLSINNWFPDVLWQSKYDLKTFFVMRWFGSQKWGRKKKETIPQSDESHKAFKA